MDGFRLSATIDRNQDLRRAPKITVEGAGLVTVALALRAELGTLGRLQR